MIPFGVLWLYREFGGWKIPFAILGGIGLLWCAGFWPWFRDEPGRMGRVNRAER